MKKTFLQNLSYLIFGLVAAFGLSFANAAFTAPSATAPGNNIAAPIHTGPDQVKDGGLSVNTFLASNATFKQQTFFTGPIYGGVPGDTWAKLKIGEQSPAEVRVSGDVRATNLIYSESLMDTNITANNNWTAVPRSSDKLCANASGTIVLCVTVEDPLPTFQLIDSGNMSYPNTIYQKFQIDGDIRVGDKFYIGTGPWEYVYYTTTKSSADFTAKQDIINNLANLAQTKDWTFPTDEFMASVYSADTIQIYVHQDYPLQAWVERQ